MDEILKVEGLKTSFMTSSGEVQAVRGVSFGVRKGEILGIVGESGSGKSVTLHDHPAAAGRHPPASRKAPSGLKGRT